MMASGENRLFTTMSRQMPVLAQSQMAGAAQSQDQGQGQLAASIPQASGPADYQIDTPITVTAQGQTPDSGAAVSVLGPEGLPAG